MELERTKMNIRRLCKNVENVIGHSFWQTWIPNKGCKLMQEKNILQRILKDISLNPGCYADNTGILNGHKKLLNIIIKNIKNNKGGKGHRYRLCIP